MYILSLTIDSGKKDIRSIAVQNGYNKINRWILPSSKLFTSVQKIWEESSSAHNRTNKTRLLGHKSLAGVVIGLDEGHLGDDGPICLAPDLDEHGRAELGELGRHVSHGDGLAETGTGPTRGHTAHGLAHRCEDGRTLAGWWALAQGQAHAFLRRAGFYVCQNALGTRKVCLRSAPLRCKNSRWSVVFWKSLFIVLELIFVRRVYHFLSILCESCIVYISCLVSSRDLL